MQAQIDEIRESQRREYLDQGLSRVKLEFKNKLGTDTTTLRQEIRTNLTENRDSDRQEYTELKQQQGHAVDQFKNLLSTDVAKIGQDMRTMLNQNRNLDRQRYTDLRRRIADARIEFQNLLRTRNNIQRQEMEEMLERNRQEQRQEFTAIRNRLNNNQAEFRQNLFTARNSIPALSTNVQRIESKSSALQGRMDAIGKEANDVVRDANGHKIILCYEYIKEN